jgi:hypothetical protein
MLAIWSNKIKQAHLYLSFVFKRLSLLSQVLQLKHEEIEVIDQNIKPS